LAFFLGALPARWKNLALIPFVAVVVRARLSGMDMRLYDEIWTQVKAK
jgi:hypothetical protein